MNGRLLRCAVCTVWMASSGLLFAQVPGAGRESAATASVSPVALQEYAGQYREGAKQETTIAVYRKGDRLFVESERIYPQELESVGKDSFVLRGVGMPWAFQRDANGKITGLQQGETHYARVSDDATPLNHGQEYVRSEEMVRVRDGVKLHVVILRPKGSEKTGDPLPILLTRTPYGANATNFSVNGMKPELASSGYIFVFADIRGRYGSEGQFVMNRPLVHKMGDRKNPKLVDESSDCYDTVDFLVKNLPNNSGRVGVMGVSYPGFLSMMAGIDHHPAVKAISPQAPMTNLWIGDDFFHNGALRQSYAFDYSLQLERGKSDQRVSMDGDLFDYFLQHGNFEGAAKAAKSENLPTTKHIIEEPAYTQSWQELAVEKRLGKPEVPTLEVGGYFDQEDMWGTQAEYLAMRPKEDPNDRQHKVFLALGPWIHGGWNGAGRVLGALDFGEPTGEEYRKQIEAPFFEWYLKDRPGFSMEDTATFRTGVNQWQHYDVWPPVTRFKPAKLYLETGGTLSFSAPKGSGDPVIYVSDPANPIPYRERPIQSTYGTGSKWRPWLGSDQKFLNGRKDLARFSTGVLDRDVTVTGDIVADIFAATTGTDGDFIVKLIDEYPADAPKPMGGYQVMIVDEIFRGRYRKSFEHPEAIEAGKVEGYRWSLHAADHTFRKGHRMMVTVQSTWFPLYDRNPQTFVPKITTAPAEAYKAATVSIMTSAKYPSHLEVLCPENELDLSMSAEPSGEAAASGAGEPVEKAMAEQ